MSIIDAFIFNDELDMLELRLHTLKDVVTAWALVEASSTFQRTPKPLHYAEHRDDPRFAPFRDRITHVIVDDLPAGTAWSRERFQRNAIRRGLAGCDQYDIILVSDVDEIPTPEAVRRLRYSSTAPLNNPSVVFKQRLYSYTLNWRHTRPWYGTRAVLYRNLGEPNALRQTQGLRYPCEPVIEDGGHSFSWFGGVESIRSKAAAFSHTNVNRPEYTNPEHVAQCIRTGTSLVAGDGNEYVWQDIDGSYPPYLLEHLNETYRNWLHPSVRDALENRP